MDKSGKTTLEIVCMITVVVAPLITAVLACKKATKPLMADVNSMHWEAPQSVVTELKAMDGKKSGTAIDPNRMTGVDANEVCSLYLVNIHNTDKNTTTNTRMFIPTALHWEVSWKSTKGLQKKEYSRTELIPLPDIPSGMNVSVKTWAACKAARPSMKEILITQKRNYPAHLNVITPVRAPFQRLDQLMPTDRWYFIPVGIGIALISIGILIRKKYFPRKQQQPV